MNTAIPITQRLATEEASAGTSFKLSVLVPVYNEVHVVEASIRRVLSLQHRTISGLEVIIVDDCSTDGTSKVLERIATATRVQWTG